ncbi:hypothetical protein ACFQX6_54070 [Streptosporangium lutulentum]
MRAGLTWLDQSVRLSPSLASQVAGPLGTAFAADSVELREKAVTLAIKHASGMDDEGRATVRDALDVLPYDLRLRAFAVFGGEEQPNPTRRTSSYRPRSPGLTPRSGWPIPSIRWRGCCPSSPAPANGWRGSGCWLASSLSCTGIARARPPRSSRLGREIRPFLPGQQPVPGPLRGPTPHWNYVDQWLVGAMRSLTGTASAPDAWKHKLPDVSGLSTPCLLLLHRAAEIQMAVEEDVVPPLLLATPTLTTGHVDASELVTRLEIIEAAGAKPLAADLQQALLRLRRDQDPRTAERAGRLSSPAGRLVARWLAGDPSRTPRSKSAGPPPTARSSAGSTTVRRTTLTR